MSISKSPLCVFLYCAICLGGCRSSDPSQSLEDTRQNDSGLSQQCDIPASHTEDAPPPVGDLWYPLLPDINNDWDTSEEVTWPQGSPWPAAQLCVPDCAGKDCGSDGCWGICGSCPQPEAMCEEAVCDEGACVVQAAHNKPCDDGEPCTFLDVCVAGVCQAGEARCESKCDDGADEDGDAAPDCADEDCLFAAECCSDSGSLHLVDSVGAQAMFPERFSEFGSAVAVADDGPDVYLASTLWGSLNVYRLTDSGWGYTHVQTLRAEEYGSTLLEPADIVLSKDSVFLYVAAELGDAVGVFRRNPATGALEHIQTIQYELDATHLNGPNSLALSPDGQFLYVASAASGSLTSFLRDPGTGLLAEFQVFKDDEEGISGLAGACSVAVSPDGSTVAVAAFWEEAMSVFKRNGNTGELELSQTLSYQDQALAGLNGPIALDFAPDKGHLYAAIFWDDQLAVFGPTAGGEELTLLQLLQNDYPTEEMGLHRANRVTVSPKGGHVYVLGHGDGSRASFARVPESGLVSFEWLDDFHSDFTKGRDVTVSRDGRVRAYAIETSGHDPYEPGPLIVEILPEELDPEGHPPLDDLNIGGDDPWEIETGMTGVNSVAQSANLEPVWTAGRYRPSPSVFGGMVTSAPTSHLVDSGTGKFLDSQCLYPEAGYSSSAADWGWVDVGDAHTVLPSPQGDRLYVASEFLDRIFVFHRDPVTLEWSVLGKATVMLPGVRSLAISNDGGNLYAVGDNWGDDNLAAFAVDSDSGILTEIQRITYLDGSEAGEYLHGPYKVMLSQDEKHVYVAANFAKAILVFARDVAGILSLAQVLTVETGGVGLPGVASMALSPTGEYLYAVGFEHGSIVAYRRSLADGTLELHQADIHADLVVPPEQCPYPESMVITPDGRDLYVGSAFHTLVHFQLDPASGYFTEGTAGLSLSDPPFRPGLLEDLAVSPDGLRVFAVSPTEGLLYVLRRPACPQ